jgi:hypothetical protein
MTNKAKRASLANGPGFLKTALIEVENEFRSRLNQKRKTITHDGTLGDAVEDDWIELFRQYLPARYRVAKAFAIDHQGKTTDQLDCLIYDAHFTPALFGKDRHLYVPAEAVYATFEIKQSVNAAHLRAAAQKAASIRKLARTSAPIPWANGINPPKNPCPILAGLLTMDASWADGLGNTFLKQFLEWTGNNELDLVLTASAGFCDRFNASRAPMSVSGEGSLMRGLFRLLAALREKATVVAIDWDKYESVLISPSLK